MTLLIGADFAGAALAVKGNPVRIAIDTPWDVPVVREGIPRTRVKPTQTSDSDCGLTESSTATYGAPPRE